jgi:glucose/arabinose dehydrogenase
VELRHLVVALALALALSAPVAHAASPTLTTVAGAGPTWPDPGGFGGDGGPATATDADLNRPALVAALPGGGFLIADSSNQRIRRVAAHGTLTTVAGDGVQCPAPTGARAVVTTTLTGSGPAQTARQVLSATAAPSAGR